MNSFWPMAAIVVLIKKIPTLLTSAQSKKMQGKNVSFISESYPCARLIRLLFIIFRNSCVSEFTCQKGILSTGLKS